MENKRNENKTEARNRKPWLNADGTHKSDKEIQKIMHSWSARTWDDYLKNFEGEQQEILLDKPESIDNIPYFDLGSLCSTPEGRMQYPYFRHLLLAAMKQLSPRELLVVKMQFWHGKTAREIAKELGALTIGVVTKPFAFEGQRRMKIADIGINEMKDKVDTLITIPNEKLLDVLGKEASLLEAFKAANG